MYLMMWYVTVCQTVWRDEVCQTVLRDRVCQTVWCDSLVLCGSVTGCVRLYGVTA